MIYWNNSVFVIQKTWTKCNKFRKYIESALILSIKNWNIKCSGWVLDVRWVYCKLHFHLFTQFSNYREINQAKWLWKWYYPLFNYALWYFSITYFQTFRWFCSGFHILDFDLIANLWYNTRKRGVWHFALYWLLNWLYKIYLSCINSTEKTWVKICKK